MSTIWVYKLVCSNEKCRHEEITDYFDKKCSVCGKPNIIVDKWPGGR
jgi:hypothetical protein